MNRQTFNQWLRKNYGKQDHRFNDLLSDAKRDKHYPWRRSYDEQMRYLLRKSVCISCLETLRDAYFEYLTDIW